MRRRSEGPLHQEALLRVPAEARLSAREWLGFVPLFRDGRWGGLCQVETGTRDRVQVDPVELFARLLPLRPAAFVLVHNHPSGWLEASNEDQELTSQVRALAAQLGIQTLGHWIVTPQGELWFGEAGRH